MRKKLYDNKNIIKQDYHFWVLEGVIHGICIKSKLNKKNIEKLNPGTVEPRYNEVLGTMKITLLYQVSHYLRVKKTKKYKELGPAKLPCYKRVLLYPTS